MRVRSLVAALGLAAMAAAACKSSPYGTPANAANRAITHEVPPVGAASIADAGCAPRGADAGASALFCEEDAGEASSSY